jgi:hypothetical protein
MAILEIGRGMASLPEAQRANRATKVASVALVPLHSPPGRLAPIVPLARPDAPFVAQLIATAERTPQTRLLRRAAAADVHLAYRSAAGRDHETAPGVRMRQSA